MKVISLLSSVIPALAAANQLAVQGQDPLFEEHRFELAQNNYRNLREFDEHGRRLLTRTLEWPECKGMNVWDAKAYIEDYILEYEGHVIKNMDLVVRQPRVAPVFDETYYFNGVRSNMEVIGQSSCDRFDGATVHRNRDNGSWSWFYANETKYVVPDLDCFDKTNAECCDIIWEHGEWMGLDKDGRHLACYVYQEPTYPFFDEDDRNLLKYSDYYNTKDGGNCVRKNYRVAPLQRQYQKVADAIVQEVIEMIDNLFQPVALTGHCVDRDGNDQNDGIVHLKRLKGFGPSAALKQDCFDLCAKYEVDTGVELTGCEAIWGGHNGRGCYGHTAEVFRGSGGKGKQRACWIDPIRPATNKIKCTDLKFVLDNSYNFARMTYLNGLMGQVQFEYYNEYCSNGEETVPVYAGLKNLLTNIKERATFTGVVEVVNFVYIVGGLDGIVVSTPRVASNNPALNPILWNSPA
jgi:hypothetical protein